MRTHPTTSSIARLPGSGRGHLADLQAALCEQLSDGWCVEQAAACDGDRLLVVMNMADEHAATFVVSITSLGVELHELRDDELQFVYRSSPSGQLVANLVARVSREHQDHYSDATT